MTKYVKIKAEMMNKLFDCFGNKEGYDEFTGQLDRTILNLIRFAKMMEKPDIEQQEIQALIGKQIFLIALFCRDNIDTIQDLVRTVEFELIDEQEKDRILDEDPLADLERIE